MERFFLLALPVGFVDVSGGFTAGVAQLPSLAAHFGFQVVGCTAM
jgi:hypothetical protein